MTSKNRSRIVTGLQKHRAPRFRPIIRTPRVDSEALLVQSELMKTIQTATRKEIKKLCEEIAHWFRPQKIILFGSHAYGEPQWDSDVDLLVIMPFRGSPHRQAVTIRNRIEAEVALDLLVRTPEQVSRRLEMGDSFMREILERGKVVYEADHQGMDQESGR